jgi:Cys-tRNA synthase (O-phospho-L-seryl-tRNA:Cys-tRNA synthase)
MTRYTRVCASVAEFVGAESSDVVMVTNATTAVNAVFRSVVKATDVVLLTNVTYNACAIAVEYICKEAGARVCGGRWLLLLPRAVRLAVLCHCCRGASLHLSPPIRQIPAVVSCLSTPLWLCDTSMWRRSLWCVVVQVVKAGVHFGEPHSTTSLEDFNARVLSSLQAALDANPDVTLALLDHVSSMPMAIFPIKEMVAACHAKGVRVMVDGAHAPGQLPLDVVDVGAEWYTGNLHKWCFASKVRVAHVGRVACVARWLTR